MYKSKSLKGDLRKMIDTDLSLVLEWRNNINVRSFMYTQHEILKEEHQSWFESTIADDFRYLLIYEEDNEPLGFLNFFENKTKVIADWGFYLSPNAPKGTGFHLGIRALDFAFYNLKLHKVCGQVLSFNERSISLHLKLGFKQEGVLKEQYYDNKHYYDVVCFGIFDHDWHQTKNEI